MSLNDYLRKSAGKWYVKFGLPLALATTPVIGGLESSVLGKDKNGIVYAGEVEPVLEKNPYKDDPVLGWFDEVISYGQKTFPFNLSGNYELFLQLYKQNPEMQSIIPENIVTNLSNGTIDEFETVHFVLTNNNQIVFGLKSPLGKTHNKIAIKNIERDDADYIYSIGSAYSGFRVQNRE